MKKKLFVLLAGLALAAAAQAQVAVTAPWIRATVPQATSAGVFMRLQSAQDARLVEVRSSAAGLAEIHQMAMDGQTMTMRAVNGIDLPAGKPVDLASGGLHIMLMDLKRQMKAGDSVPLTLLIQVKGKKPQTLEVQVPVKPLTYVAPAPAAMVH
ncbi:MAG TPA: copper chaperone PCu(A)C [Janthinobacterium sp.]|jgi:copper(I)-binding protein|nr:copper chaperone PCu(A)C [Janthinobacterium sp.]